MKIKKEDFIKQVKRQLEKDTDEVVQQLVEFVDTAIISHKFDDGFPGHELQPTTIKKKGSNKVGVDTGALMRAATALNNWDVSTTVAGTQRFAARKQVFGLTAYSHYVRTKIGGQIDFLSITDEDIVKLQSKTKELFSRKKYTSSGRIRKIIKEI